MVERSSKVPSELANQLATQLEDALIGGLTRYSNQSQLQKLASGERVGIPKDDNAGLLPGNRGRNVNLVG